MNDKEMKDAVIKMAHQYLNKFFDEFSSHIVPGRECMPEIIFTKRGTCAGCVSYKGKYPVINFNMGILRENFDNFKKTIIHEVSHFCVWAMHGHIYKRSGRRVIHGKEWKSMMRYFGEEPTTTHKYDVTNHKRVMRRFKYYCDCSDHEVSATIHNRIKKGAVYVCKTCKTKIHQ